MQKFQVSFKMDEWLSSDNPLLVCLENASLLASQAYSMRRRSQALFEAEEEPIEITLLLTKSSA